MSKKESIENIEYLKLFLDAKRIEGYSERTLQYYSVTVEHMLSKINTPIRKMTTDEIRAYLVEYQQHGGCSKVTVDNIRRNISSFFSWLEEEDYKVPRGQRVQGGRGARAAEGRRRAYHRSGRQDPLG